MTNLRSVISYFVCDLIVLVDFKFITPGILDGKNASPGVQGFFRISMNKKPMLQENMR